MNIGYLEKVPSFQQRVARVVVDGSYGYAKQIITDYSWWTCDDADVYRREVASYSLLNGAGIGPPLLHRDDREKRLVIVELSRRNPEGDEVKPYLENVVALLQALSRLKAPELQCYTALGLAAQHEERARQADVDERLVAECVQMLEEWHAVYGGDTAYIHGDLHPGNLFAQGGTVAGLIDFEEAIESLPVFDAANIAWCIHGRYGDEAYDQLCRRYRRAFGVEIIPWPQWLRYFRLRGWIASSYLKACCPPDLQQRARGFSVAAAPETVAPDIAAPETPVPAVAA